MQSEACSSNGNRSSVQADEYQPTEGALHPSSGHPGQHPVSAEAGKTEGDIQAHLLCNSNRQERYGID